MPIISLWGRWSCYSASKAISIKCRVMSQPKPLTHISVGDVMMRVGVRISRTSRVERHIKNNNGTSILNMSLLPFSIWILPPERRHDLWSRALATPMKIWPTDAWGWKLEIKWERVKVPFTIFSPRPHKQRYEGEKKKFQHCVLIPSSQTQKCSSCVVATHHRLHSK